jgi:hypothetical protein
MRSVFLGTVALLAACGAGAQVAPPPRGVEANLEEAKRHEADARRHEELAASAEAAAARTAPGAEYVCGDSVLAAQTTSGGERLVSNAPCWTKEVDVARRHRSEADALRADAASHRSQARALLAAEQASCASMPADELDHTPFAHRDDIAAVTARLDDDRLVGVRVRFRQVSGLTAEWLRDAITCHQARAAALGFEPRYMAYDPTVLEDVEVKVTDDGQGAIVDIRAHSREAALIAYARAEALLDP